MEQRKVREAIEGKEYTVGKDGKFNIRCGGSYSVTDGKLMRVDAEPAKAVKKVTKNEVQK